MAKTPHLRKPADGRVRRNWDEVVENDLRLHREAAERIVEALNSELSGLYILFNQVRKHYWLVEGANSREVGEFLAGATDRLSEMTDDLAIRVHALGGVPVCGPMGIRQHAPIHIEAPHHYDVRSSLGRDLEGYAELAVQFREHIGLAEELNDPTTGELLREHSKTIEKDAHTIERYLADDTLVRRDALQ
ncbi:DNA starvation/stationary phase protection protein DpsA [Haloparvum alkalitolerans]|uniref:DNA starvation/stationary phase protection protein DpsA n=1 Tax=Haloparvum alkalitolerans TaxID=1042953 RepID=UPI003CF39309